MSEKRSRIKFKRNGKPTVTNPKCKQCLKDCKQHIGLKIVTCPYFRSAQSFKETEEYPLRKGKTFKNGPATDGNIKRG